ncbi:hypothetical protein NPIL_420981 [Nephila pilipes]|uniref:Uncharacterized protein n=1 Tax=Nephila pilipes TaxID=299642 RepID=A0A8X6QGC8_NEPPI|nr:hypothetical protein NPIL_420981 [Nephila pilipes]
MAPRSARASSGTDGRHSLGPCRTWHISATAAATATGPVTSSGPGAHTHPAVLAGAPQWKKRAWVEGTCAEGDGIVTMETLVNIHALLFLLFLFPPLNLCAKVEVLIVKARSVNRSSKIYRLFPTTLEGTFSPGTDTDGAR